AEEYRRFLEGQTRLAEIEAQRQRNLDEKEQSRLKALADKGEADRALSELRTAKDKEIADARTRAEALETQILGDRKDAVITAALLGTSFVGDEAAAQV